MADPAKVDSVAPSVFGPAGDAERVEMADYAEEVAGVGAYLVRDGRAYWSDGMRRMLGFTPDEVIDTKTFFARVHPDDRTRLQAQYGRVMSGSRQPVTEFRVVLPDGTIRHVRGERTLRRDAEGRGTLIGVIVDVTAERTIRSEIEALRARHHETQRAAGVGTHVSELSTGRLEWSPEFFRLFGLTPDRAPAVELMLAQVDEHDRARHADWLTRLTRRETVEPLVLRVNREGGARFVELRCRHVLGPSGGEELLGVAIDVTERQALEDQLRQAAALEAVGTLAAGVAHDFNNQLTVMSLQLRRLEGSAPGEDVEGLRHALEQSALLTRQLLALARVEHGPPRVVDLAAVCRRVAAILGRVAEPGLTVSFEGPDAPSLARVDEAQIESAVMNLAFNARDAMPQGGRLTISLSRTGATEPEGELPEGAFHRLAVTDTGSGIPAELLGRIFEPYFTTKELGRGTGLGLASVEAIARQHGGRVRVESQRAGGSTFELLIPAEDRASRPFEAPRSAPPIARLAGRRILVADDNSALLALVARSLRDLGAEVFTADNGAVAVEVLRDRGPVDVVLTDVRMPVLDGLGLAAELESVAPGTPIVFMTGYAESDLATPSVPGGAPRRVLLKPFRPDDLVAIISRALQAPRDSDPG